MAGPVHPDYFWATGGRLRLLTPRFTNILQNRDREEAERSANPPSCFFLAGRPTRGRTEIDKLLQRLFVAFGRQSGLLIRIASRCQIAVNLIQCAYSRLVGGRLAGIRLLLFSQGLRAFRTRRDATVKELSLRTVMVTLRHESHRDS